MPDEELSVEGPDFAAKVKETEEIVRRLESNNWDFAAAEEVFAKKASADVVAKEIATIYDGKILTRIGRLVMAGVGTHFNLMGGIPALSSLRTTDSRLLDSVRGQVGGGGLAQFPELKAMGAPQLVDFYNYTMFYQLRDLVFWSVLNGSGCSPSTLEHMARNFAEGDIVQNVMYRPSRPGLEGAGPALMEAACLMYSYPSQDIEWMRKPLFGGLIRETMHIEYLLTLEPNTASHPYLDLVDEGVIEYGSQRYFIRHFSGVAPKEGLRGPGIGPEQS